MKKSNLLALVFGIPLLTLLMPTSALAVPGAFSYEGRVYDSGGNPASGSATFNLRITNPAGDCVIYEEQTVAIDLAATNGFFSVSVGNGTRTATFSGRTLNSVFSNRAASITGVAPGTTNSCTYNPSVSDGRKLQVVVNQGASSITMTPNIDIGSSPFAVIADDANTVGGQLPSSFLNLDLSYLTQANLAYVFSPTKYPNLKNLVDGTSTQYLSSSGSNGTVLAGAPASPVAGSIWYDNTSSTLKFYNGSTGLSLGTSGGSVTAVIAGSGLTGGTISTSGTIGLATGGVTANELASGAVTGAKLASNIAITTTGNLSAGSITGTSVQSTTDSTKNLWLYEPTSTYKAQLQAPASLATNYTLVLPPTLGSAGTVLSTDATGNLSWVTPSGSSQWTTSGANIYYTAGYIGVGTSSPVVGAVADFASTGATSAIVVPRAASSARPNGVNGMLRYNTTSAKFEGYESGAWVNVIGAGAGFVNGGNSFGTNANIGTLDAYPLIFSTNNTQRAVFDTSGRLGVGTISPGFPVHILSQGVIGAAIEGATGLTSVGLSLRSNYSSGGLSMFTLRSNSTGTAGQGYFTIYDDMAAATRFTIDKQGQAGVGTLTPQAMLDVAGTGAWSAMLVPRDSSGQRPAGVNGMLRYNTTANSFEGYAANTWISLSGTGGGGGGSYLPLSGGVMTGALQATPGSSSAPGYAFSSDSTSGMYMSGSGVVSLAVGGINRLSVSTGAVGVGTIAPQAAFDVYGLGSQSALLVPRDSGSNRPLGVNGMIRYNTTAASLEAYANGNWSFFGGGAPLSGIFGATASNTIDNLNFAQNWNWSTATTQTAHSINTNALSTGSALSIATSSPSFNSTNGLLYVANSSSGMNGVVARIQANSTVGAGLTVMANGNVGIGTTAPLASLDLGYRTDAMVLPSGPQGARPASAVAGMMRYNATAGKIEAYESGNWASYAPSTGTNAAFLNNGNSFAAAATLGTNDAYPVFIKAGGATILAVTAAGNFGVGTIAPSAKLEVTGHIAVSGTSATVGTCGTSPAITGNDTRGVVTLGTGGPTSCVVTFATSYLTAPYCVITPSGGLPGAIQWYVATTATTMTMTFSATPTTSQQFVYYCIQ